MQNRIAADRRRTSGWRRLQSDQVRCRASGWRSPRRPACATSRSRRAPRRLLDVRDEGHRYNIVDWTPYKRDPLKALADECRGRASSSSSTTRSSTGITRTSGRAATPAARTGRPESGEWTRYLDFMDAQLTELLTNYGPIGGIWFDGMWDKPGRRLAARSDLHAHPPLQPAALIVPNHHKAPLPGRGRADVRAGSAGRQHGRVQHDEIGALPLETSITMNGAWGFNITDRKFKCRCPISSAISCARRATTPTLLLNVGPRPDGTIQPEAVERLQRGRAWLADVRRVDLRHAAGPNRAAIVGRDDPEGQHRLRARARLAGRGPRHPLARRPASSRHVPEGWCRGTFHGTARRHAAALAGSEQPRRLRHRHCIRDVKDSAGTACSLPPGPYQSAQAVGAP